MLIGSSVSAQTLTAKQSCELFAAMGSKIAKFRDDGMTLKECRIKYSAGMKDRHAFSDANRKYIQALIGMIYKKLGNLPPESIEQAVLQSCLTNPN